MKLRIFITESIAILFISLMFYAAISKLIDYNLSREQMAMMPQLNPIAHIMAWLLPVIEILVAIIIFIPKTRLVGIKSFTTLMFIFLMYIIYMMRYYEHLPCSCGGLTQELSWTGHLIFNGVFIGLGIIYLLLYRYSYKSNSRNIFSTTSKKINAI